MAYGVVPSTVREFRAQTPGVEVRLVEMTTAEQERALLDRSLDLGFCYGPLEHAEFETVLIASESLMVAMSASHQLARRRRVPLAVVRHEPFISFPRRLSPGLYDSIAAACRSAEFTPSVIQEATQMQTIVALVDAGMGIAIVPESMSALVRAGVVYRPIQGRAARIQTLLAWRASHVYTAMARFVEMARRSAPSARRVPEDR
jgi:DNA-binding transcriptional LysR family regulator